MLGERRRRDRECFRESGAELAGIVSHAGLCRLFGTFLGAVEGPHSRGDGVSNGHDLLKSRDRDLSLEDVAKDAAHGCGGSFRFLEKSKNGVVKFGVVAVGVLHLSGEENCAKDEKTGAELFVEGIFLQRGGCKVD